MEKKVLIVIFAILFISCENVKDLKINIISNHYKNIGDSLVLVKYENDKGFNVYNCVVKEKPIIIYNNIDGLIETSYQQINDKIILSKTVYKKKNYNKDDRNELIRKGLLKIAPPFIDDRLDGLKFIFSKNKYIIVKENVFSEVYNNLNMSYIKKFGIKDKQGFKKLPQAYIDSAMINTYKFLWKKNKLYNER